MGQCCAKRQSETERPQAKQNKNTDDKRMLKVGIEVLKKDFCVQIGYNRRAVKNYSAAVGYTGVRNTNVNHSQSTNNLNIETEQEQGSKT